MTIREMDEIVRLMRGSYAGMFRDDDTIRVWYEKLRSYNFRDVLDATGEWIQTESKWPFISDILSKTKHYAASRKNMERLSGERIASCPFCSDRGLIVHTSPMGIITGVPCDMCNMGKLKYPWYFMTKEQQDEYTKDEEKQGKKPPRHISEAPRDFYMRYVYGTE